jgi:alkylhydroperoxidase/carboxymuconolactone decarboxylase family protein YurZ
MTRQQLIDALEHATFYGTWDDACKAQAALDNFDNGETQ